MEVPGKISSARVQVLRAEMSAGGGQKWEAVKWKLARLEEQIGKTTSHKLEQS